MQLLEIILPESTAWLIGIILLVTFLILINKYLSVKKQRDNTLISIEDKELKWQKAYAETKLYYQNWAYDELEKFKSNELNRINKQAEEHYSKAANIALEKWIYENEMKIRQDAIKRSYSVNLGKISEHLIPFHADFYSKFNPQDVRFIGSPIDLIIFDGHSEKKDEITIYIVEVKTGNSRLTKSQQIIKRSVLEKKIVWVEINPNQESSVEIFYN